MHFKVEGLEPIDQTTDELKSKDDTLKKHVPLDEAITLYSLQGINIGVYKKLLYYGERLKSSHSREWKDLEHNLALQYQRLGWYDDADIIAMKYLERNEADVNFISIKMNIEKGRGNIDLMKEYKAKLLKSCPRIFIEHALHPKK